MHKIHWLGYVFCVVGILTLWFFYWLETRKESEREEMGVRLGRGNQED